MSTLSCSGFVRGLPSIRNYPAGGVGPTWVHLTPSIGYEFLQCISNTTAGGKTLPIEVIPVANCYNNNRSQYLGGGLTGPVVASSIQAMQFIILIYTTIHSDSLTCKLSQGDVADGWLDWRYPWPASQDILYCDKTHTSRVH